MRSTTKSQAYVIDYIIAMVLFAITITIYYSFEPNVIAKVDNDKNDLQMEARTISSSLVSEGIPTNWDIDPTNAIRLGLTDQNRIINDSKLKRFYNMSNSNASYSMQKTKLNVKNDFLIYIRNKDGATIQITINTTQVNQTGFYDPSAKKISRVSRIIGYNDSLVELVVLSWKK